MRRDLLLVIDMQNIYGKGGQWCCPAMEAATETIKTVLEKSDINCIFTRFLAPENPVGVWNAYNQENAAANADAYANAMSDAFTDLLNRYPLYTKSTYSSLPIPEVLAAARAAQRVVVSGVVAECCVLATVLGLIDEGCKVIYLTDAVAGINQTTEQAVETVLSGLSPLHVELMTAAQYLG